MDLGAFSVSLTVEDLGASRAFYERLGFEAVGGDGEQWQILRNGTTTLGLFQGMFDRNTLTFNPGWDARGEPTETYTDIREIERRLDDAGVEIVQRTEPGTDGPAHLMLIDPDGNPVLLDQHR
ncbi:hypothetical protein ARHIZOSPH14_32330 [Agromyces rhizosphaerae]|uniref:VOC domain-containing protein n=1 Tax=Agromyces rhizosphaerae TaxID=88374 RepID=A0A9W6CTZ6_9MICO|nr:VOC family protein [Agromyces rhizosphaerae]GLI28991.1 hypothetical protein ARHIZOSPH14_32330 [Agromyces rhizosphaerae]